MYDQGVEGAFGAAEEPVDGTLFVSLLWWLVEVFEEVVADRLQLFGSQVCRDRVHLQGT